MIVRMTMHHPEPFSAKRERSRATHVSPAQIISTRPDWRFVQGEGERTFRLFDEVFDPLCRLVEFSLGRVYLSVQLVQHPEG